MLFVGPGMYLAGAIAGEGPRPGFGSEPVLLIRLTEPTAGMVFPLPTHPRDLGM